MIFWDFLFLLLFSFLYFGSIFDKTIILLALVGYEMIIANSALRTLLAIYHLISKACSWNNCYSVTNSTGATQPFSAYHKTSSEQKNRSLFTVGPITNEGLAVKSCLFPSTKRELLNITVRYHEFSKLKRTKQKLNTFIQ